MVRVWRKLEATFEHIKKREWPTTQNHVENGWPANADDIPDNISVRLGIDLFATAKPGTLLLVCC